MHRPACTANNAVCAALRRAREDAGRARRQDGLHGEHPLSCRLLPAATSTSCQHPAACLPCTARQHCFRDSLPLCPNVLVAMAVVGPWRKQVCGSAAMQPATCTEGLAWSVALPRFGPPPNPSYQPRARLFAPRGLYPPAPQAHPRRVAKVAKQIEREVGNLLITDKVGAGRICVQRCKRLCAASLVKARVAWTGRRMPAALQGRATGRRLGSAPAAGHAGAAAKGGMCCM